MNLKRVLASTAAAAAAVVAVSVPAAANAATADTTVDNPSLAFGWYFAANNPYTGADANGTPFAGHFMDAKGNNVAVSSLADVCPTGTYPTLYAASPQGDWNYKSDAQSDPNNFWSGWNWNATYADVLSQVGIKGGVQGAVVNSGYMAYGTHDMATGMLTMNPHEVLVQPKDMDVNTTYEVDCHKYPVPYPTGTPYDGSGKFILNREKVTKTTTQTIVVPAVYKTVETSALYQVDRYTTTNVRGTNVLPGTSRYYRQRAGAATLTQRQSIASLDNDNVLGYREDGRLWTSTQHKFVNVSSADVRKYGLAKALSLKTGWPVPTSNVAGTAVAPGSVTVKAWKVDTAHGATIAAPWGVKKNLVQRDFDSVPAPVAKTVLVSKATTITKTTTDVQDIAIADEQRWLDLGYTVVAGSQYYRP